MPQMVPMIVPTTISSQCQSIQHAVLGTPYVYVYITTHAYAHRPHKGTAASHRAIDNQPTRILDSRLDFTVSTMERNPQQVTWGRSHGPVHDPAAVGLRLRWSHLLGLYQHTPCLQHQPGHNLKTPAGV
jgi:hypothetical protein